MTHTTPTFDRRTVLKTAALAAGTALAGCQGSPDPASEPSSTSTTPADPAQARTRLPPPENWENLRDADVPYPKYGDRLPEAIIEAPLEDRAYSTREFVGDRLTLITFVYTRCGSICPALTANLVQVQADAAERGYSDRIALFPITFDPAYDTAERLRAFGEARGADVDADNWHFLRPADEDAVDAVVVDTFGHPFQENEGEGMPFLHNPLLVLVNEAGYVERGYANTVPDPATVVADVRTLLEA